jgi:hypothetical protein
MDPSRASNAGGVAIPVDDPGDRGGLPDSADVGGSLLDAVAFAPSVGTCHRNNAALDRMTDRSRTARRICPSGKPGAGALLPWPPSFSRGRDWTMATLSGKLNSTRTVGPFFKGRQKQNPDRC